MTEFNPVEALANLFADRKTGKITEAECIAQAA